MWNEHDAVREAEVQDVGEQADPENGVADEEAELIQQFNARIILALNHLINTPKHT